MTLGDSYIGIYIPQTDKSSHSTEGSLEARNKTKLDASTMVVLACASVFNSHAFLSLFGLLFQFCRNHHAKAMRWH